MRRTRLRDEEDGFALVLSLLLIMVVAGLSLAMAAVVLNQARPVQQARKLVQTVNAAQSGLQVALSTVRAANDGTSGSLAKLPSRAPPRASFSSGGSSASFSVPGTSLTGAVSAVAGTGTPTYRVSVAYYRFDPSGKDATWLSDGTNVLSCPLSEVPAYAYLQSYGAGAPVAGSAATQGNRNQVATYTFSRTNVNKVGGRLRSYGTQQCLDAGPAPAVGTLPTMQPCLALGTTSQLWQYRTDLTIFYGGDSSLNLCVQAPSTGTRAVLQTCTGNGTGSTYPYAPGQQVQEWGFNDNGHFAAALDNGTVTNYSGGPCLQPEGAGSTAAPSGAALVVVSCDYDVTGPAAFDPDPQVGAGKAGGAVSGLPGATRQYVNYAQFGRCLDITDAKVTSDHLIAYPCKQAPDSSQLTFNQVWDYAPDSTGYGAFFSTYNGVHYCLTAPTTGKLITTTACESSLPGSQLWRASGQVGTDYPASYVLTSRLTGGCMAVSPLSESLGYSVSNIVLVTCDGSASQKWNAPPVEPSGRLGSIHEPTGG